MRINCIVIRAHQLHFGFVYLHLCLPVALIVLCSVSVQSTHYITVISWRDIHRLIRRVASRLFHGCRGTRIYFDT